jgi:hypothetical protein
MRLRPQGTKNDGYVKFWKYAPRLQVLLCKLDYEDIEREDSAALVPGGSRHEILIQSKI